MRAIRRLLVAVLAAFTFATASPIAVAERPQLFTTEQTAKQHCPTDVVVWLNTQSGVYHFKGQRWYANTKRGAFVCQKEANAGGSRATRNGQ